MKLNIKRGVKLCIRNSGSLVELSKNMGTTTANITNLYQSNNIGLDRMIKLCKASGTNVDEFIRAVTR